MKQKYVISRDEKKNELSFKEYGELDKEALSLLCEQKYDGAVVEASIVKGKVPLINLLRTKNFYPPSIYMDPIADAVIALYKSGDLSTEVLFDDMELLFGDHIEKVSEVVEEETEDYEELLDEADSLEDEFGDDEIDINDNASLKIADDEVLDIEDEG
jgi:hypothetical protein